MNHEQKTIFTDFPLPLVHTEKPVFGQRIPSFLRSNREGGEMKDWKPNLQ